MNSRHCIEVTKVRRISGGWAAACVVRLGIAVLLLLLPILADALEIPPPPKQWVTDTAGVLGGTETDLLNTKLRTFEERSGAQFIIYIFPSLGGEAVEDFTIRTVERWKVGQTKYDNGLVLFVFVEEKVVRVEVGYGLEGSITDAVSSRVIREEMAPHFRAGNYAAGLNAAADEIIARITSGEAAVPPLRQPGARQPQGEEPSPLVVLIILFIVFFVVVPMFTRRRSGCGGCMLPIFPGGGITFGGGGFSGGGGGFGGFGGGGGFSGGGGGFGGGGATGGW